MNYDVDYFIDKFEAIRENEIGEMSTRNNCALTHVGSHCYNETPEALALADLLRTVIPVEVSEAEGYSMGRLDPVYLVNDGIGMVHNAVYAAFSPKQRILAALRYIKAKQQPTKIMVIDDKPLPARIVYVTVDKEVRDLQKAELPQS